MYGRTVCVTAVAATCVVGSSALLIPPGVNSLEGALDLGGPFLFKERTVDLPCPSCGLPPCPIDAEVIRPVDDLFWIQDAQQSLSLQLRLSDDYRRLEVNGLPIFALDDIYDSENERAEPSVRAAVRSFVLQQRFTPADAEANDQTLTTSIPFRSEARHIRKTNKYGGAYIVIDVEMLGWRARFPNQGHVVVELLRLGSDGLLLYGATAVDSRDGRPSDTHSNTDNHVLPTIEPIKSDERPQSCSLLPSSLCKIKTLVEAKLSSAQSVRYHHHHHHHEYSHRFFDRFLTPPPCPGRPNREILDSSTPSTDPSSVLDILNDSRPPPPFPLGRPHHMRPYGRHHHHHDHDHSFLGSVAPWLIAILIPVVAGITIGLTACLVGLLAGRIVQILWISIVRGGRKGHARRSCDMLSADDDDESSFGRTATSERYWCEDVDPVPAYEHAPAYEAVEGEQQVK